MKSFIIIAIILLGVSQAVELGITEMYGYPINFSQKRSILTLLTQVEAMMKSNGPLDQITKMLNEFKDQIVNEQVAHDNLYQRQQVECVSEREFRQKEIDDATSAQKAAQETLDGCTQQQVRAQADLAQNKNQYSEILTYQIVVEETEKAAKYSYETQVTAQKLVIEALQEALIILEEYFQGLQSFSQLTSHANKMLKLFITTKKTYAMGPILQAFVQLESSNDFDEIAVKRVKVLINNLLDQAQETLAKLVEDNDLRITNFNEESSRLQTLIQSYVDEIAALESEIAQLNKCIVNQTGIVSSASAKIARNQQLLNDTNNLCDACSVEYEQATKARKSELKLLAALRERVEARFGQLSSGVRERGEQDTFSYNAENDYEKKTFAPSQ